jgi:predicted metal-binding membrane protein
MPLMMGGPSDMMTMTGVAAMVSSLSLPYVAFFEVIWIIGMAAMMFPAMIPVVTFYNKVVAKSEASPERSRILGTPAFLTGYLMTYALLGVGAYLAVYAGIALSSTFPVLSALSIVAPAAVLVAAGVYQFSSLKTRCLSQCVSPFGFFATHTAKGITGAISMGFSHGAFCVGCCWAYMLVMLAVGAMSLPVMAALAGLIAVEKVIVRGSAWFNRSVGFGLVGLGIIVALFPNLLVSV